MSTTAPTATGGIELKEAERQVIAWQADSCLTTLGEEMEGGDNSFEDFAYLVERGQWTLELWRAAEAGWLTPSAESREWLEALRLDLVRYVGYHHKALDDGCSSVFVGREREQDLAEDLARRAACESLLDRLGA